jgi:hypothetical protein
MEILYSLRSSPLEGETQASGKIIFPHLCWNIMLSESTTVFAAVLQVVNKETDPRKHRKILPKKKPEKHADS